MTRYRSSGRSFVQSLAGWGAAVRGHNGNEARAARGVTLLRLILHGRKEAREWERERAEGIVVAKKPVVA
jgi:hypothetical protein